MNVYRIYILIVDLFFTPLLMIDKKGENDFEFIYVYLEIEFMHILSLYMFYILCLYKKGEKDFASLHKKGKKVFGERNLFMHIYFV